MEPHIEVPSVQTEVEVYASIRKTMMTRRMKSPEEEWGVSTRSEDEGMFDNNAGFWCTSNH